MYCIAVTLRAYSSQKGSSKYAVRLQAYMLYRSYVAGVFESEGNREGRN